jgi:hypothetical protein
MSGRDFSSGGGILRGSNSASAERDADFDIFFNSDRQHRCQKQYGNAIM